MDQPYNLLAPLNGLQYNALLKQDNNSVQNMHLYKRANKNVFFFKRDYICMLLMPSSSLKKFLFKICISYKRAKKCFWKRDYICMLLITQIDVLFQFYT